MQRFPIRIRSVVVVVAGVLWLAACGGGGGGGSGGAGPGGGATNTAPTADAGHDITALKNTTVVLDASGSTDPQSNPLSYAWTVLSIPAGSAAVLSSATAVSPVFVADLPGLYSFSLVVNDGALNSTTDTVNIVVLASTSNLHDTGMTRCYNQSAEVPCPASGNAYAGQDAQYSSHPMRFTDNGDTISDSLTGLMWQATWSPTTHNWYQAAGVYNATYNATTANVCGALTTGGFNDWRLPTRRELVSILDVTGGSSFSGGATFWSSTHLGNPTNDNVWVVMGNRVEMAGAFTDGMHAAYNVKCVRGTTWGNNTGYTDYGDGTVTDNTSGLRWQRNDDGVARTWQESLAYCENLNYATFDDWRLPDIKELESLVLADPANFTLPVNTVQFTPRVDLGGQSFYWSSTTNGTSYATGQALGVDFSYGNVGDGGFGKANYKFARCVR